MWNSNSIKAIYSFKGEGFFLVKIRWKNNLYCIVNVYSTCDLSLKRRMCGELLDLRKKLADGPWMIGVILKSSERKNNVSTNRRSEMRGFRDFVEESDLVDVSCIGNSFTWFVGNRESVSRIDRFLIFESLLKRWGVVGQVIGRRDISDHFPIWLNINKEDWGAKPFRTNNAWFDNKDFLKFAEKE